MRGRDFFWLILLAGMAVIAMGQRVELNRYQDMYRNVDQALKDAAAVQSEARRAVEDAAEQIKRLEKELETVGQIQAYIHLVNPDLSPEVAPVVARQLYEAADRHGVSWELVVALAGAESRFDPQVVSWAGAIGVMQLTPETAQDLGVDNPFDSAQNIDGGVRYLAWLLRIYGGDRDLSIAAYNAGPGRVRDSIPNIRETQLHVRRVQLASRGLTRGRNAR